MSCGGGADCRLCGSRLRTTFVDLGVMPLANSYLPPDAVDEPRFPLHPFVCDSCLLVQVHHGVSPEQIFSDYAYFSSYSTSWLRHAEQFATAAIRRWDLGPQSLVVEVASNDGYLLRNFLPHGIPVLGIEPAANVAREAERIGVRTVVEFLGEEPGRRLAAEGVEAALLVANNVLAHVPDLNDFVAGLAALLAPDGVLSVEFPHLLNLIEQVQFDTIYHEHFSYFSLIAAEAVLARHGMRVFDVEEIPTHGGSLRLLACHAGSSRAAGSGLEHVRRREREAGLHELSTYAGFTAQVQAARESVRRFFADVRRKGETVVAYGAAAKGNTLLNSCGLTRGDILFAVDRNPHKQGLLLPGSHIPIRDPGEVARVQPDYLFILPWNLRDEIMEQMAHIRSWGGRFVTPLPRVHVHP